MSTRANLVTTTLEEHGKSLVTQKKSMSSSKYSNSTVDPILLLQRTVGNQAVQRLIKSGVLETKLTVGKPNDIYEQEAERVADDVMRMPGPSAAEKTAPSDQIQVHNIQRVCTECEKELHRQPIEEEEELQMQTVKEEEELQMQPMEEEEEEVVQSKKALSQPPEVTSDLESSIYAQRRWGQPLPEPSRSFFEPRFGVDFSDVRVHTGSESNSLNRSLNAKAFTTGRDIFFRNGEYNPGSAGGRGLLAHELTHVVQQSGADGIRADQSNEKRGLSPVSQKIQTVSLQRQLGSDELDELKQSATGKVVTTEWLLAWALREGLDYRAAWRRITASHEFTGSEEARDRAGTALAFRLPSDLRAMRDRDPSKLSDAQIGATAEFKDYMDSKLVWQWYHKMTKEEALLACRLIVRRLREGYAVRWLEHAADFVNLARKQLGTLKETVGFVGKLKWVPFSTTTAVSDPSMLDSDFGRWMLAGGPEPDKSTGKVNCWEMVLFSALKGGFTSKQRIGDMYAEAVNQVRAGTRSFVGDTIEIELRRGNEYILDSTDPRTPEPLPGDVVIFTKAKNHVAISLGTKDGQGRHKVISHWPPPDGSYKTKETTIEQLLAPMDPGQTVKFWSPSW